MIIKSKTLDGFSGRIDSEFRVNIRNGHLVEIRDDTYQYVCVDIELLREIIKEYDKCSS